MGKIIYISNGKMGRTRKKKYEHVKMCEHMRTFLFTNHLNEWVSVCVCDSWKSCVLISWFRFVTISIRKYLHLWQSNIVTVSKISNENKKYSRPLKFSYFFFYFLRNIVDQSSKIEMLFAYTKFIERFVVHAINFIQFNILQSI